MTTSMLHRGDRAVRRWVPDVVPVVEAPAPGRRTSVLGVVAGLASGAVAAAVTLAVVTSADGAADLGGPGTEPAGSVSGGTSAQVPHPRPGPPARPEE